MNIRIKDSEDLLDVLEPFKVDFNKYNHIMQYIHRTAGNRARISIGTINHETFLDIDIQEYFTPHIYGYYLIPWMYSIERFVEEVERFGFTPENNKIFMNRPSYVEKDKENELFEILLDLVCDVGDVYRLK